MLQLSCPKCHQPLFQEGNSYKCKAGHCYDIAKSKYINLLLNPDKSTNNPGDSKDSLRARKAFLNQGYYDGILKQVLSCIEKNYHEHMQILDLGCGEGYYTYGLKRHLPDATIYGLDISKEAILMASKYSKEITWIVGNSKNIPINDHSLDVICALFTVVNHDELKRCLKEDGSIIHVTANRDHLIELKHLIYDEIKEKPDTFIRLPFSVVDSYDYKETLHITNREDSLNLLKMTPHYYHIKKEKRSVLDTLDTIDVTIDIKITIYAIS